jgi:hypothetical protein
VLCATTSYRDDPTHFLPYVLSVGSSPVVPDELPPSAARNSTLSARAHNAFVPRLAIDKIDEDIGIKHPDHCHCLPWSFGCCRFTEPLNWPTTAMICSKVSLPGSKRTPAPERLICTWLPENLNSFGKRTAWLFQCLNIFAVFIDDSSNRYIEYIHLAARHADNYGIALASVAVTSTVAIVVLTSIGREARDVQMG